MLCLNYKQCIKSIWSWMHKDQVHHCEDFFFFFTVMLFEQMTNLIKKYIHIYFGHLRQRTDQKDPDAGKDWRQEEQRDDRGWDGWMASLARWTWVWTISRNWWWMGKAGVLQFMGSQRVRHDWATELNLFIFTSQISEYDLIVHPNL